MSITTFLQDALIEIEHDLQPVEEAVIDFGKELLSLLVTGGGHLLISAATAAVEAAEAGGGNGESKFEDAKQAVIGTLEDAGVQIILSAVHGAIEFAVAKLNAPK